MSEAQLPDDTHLAYIVWREAWFADPAEQPKIQVQASARGTGGGVAWEFAVEEIQLTSSQAAIQIQIFDDAFAAFAQIPEFFAALARENAGTLTEVQSALDRMGAKDETERRDPAARTSGFMEIKKGDLINITRNGATSRVRVAVVKDLGGGRIIYETEPAG